MSHYGKNERRVDEGRRESNNNNNNDNHVVAGITGKNSISNSSSTYNNNNNADSRSISNPIKNFLVRTVFVKSPSKITAFSPALTPSMMSYSSTSLQRNGQDQLDFSLYNSKNNNMDSRNSFLFLDDGLNDLSGQYNANKRWTLKQQQNSGNSSRESNGRYIYSSFNDYLVKRYLQNNAEDNKRLNSNSSDKAFDLDKLDNKKEDRLGIRLAESIRQKKDNVDALDTDSIHQKDGIEYNNPRLHHDIYSTTAGKSKVDKKLAKRLEDKFYHREKQIQDTTSNSVSESDEFINQKHLKNNRFDSTLRLNEKKSSELSNHSLADNLYKDTIERAKKNEKEVTGSAFRSLQKQNEKQMNRFYSQVNSNLNQYHFQKNVDVTINIGKIEIKSSKGSNSSSQYNNIASKNNNSLLGAEAAKTKNSSPFLKPKISLSEYIRLRNKSNDH
ncbi:MAG: hypothetical protein R2685_15720 [Candidatus Nitrosocosmicus sp.]|nr:hypothetical protein [Candidatus Nitrosocosmicus sp.]